MKGGSNSRGKRGLKGGGKGCRGLGKGSIPDLEGGSNPEGKGGSKSGGKGVRGPRNWGILALKHLKVGGVCIKSWGRLSPLTF